MVLLLNLSRPFINLDRIGDFAHGTPALIMLGLQQPRGLVHHDSDFRTYAERVSLFISHGANVNASDHHGDTCLHTFLSWEIAPGETTGYHHENALRRKIILKDILMIICTAGATVNAINNYGESPLDVATVFGNDGLWKEVLIECGYDVEKVCREADPDIGWSTAVDGDDARHDSLLTGCTPTLSLADYLTWREISGLSDQIKNFPEGEKGYVVVGTRTRFREIEGDEDSASGSDEYESSYEDGYKDDSDDDKHKDQYNDESEDKDYEENWGGKFSTPDAQQTSAGQYRTKHKVG